MEGFFQIIAGTPLLVIPELLQNGAQRGCVQCPLTSGMASSDGPTAKPAEQPPDARHHRDAARRVCLRALLGNFFPREG